MNNIIIGLWERHSATILILLQNIIVSLIIITAGFLLSRAAQRLLLKAGSAAKTDGTVNIVLRSIVRYGILVVCGIMILNVFGINTASLLALLGAAGVAVGLALKDTLGNIAAGITLLVLGSCRKGEYIEFGSYSGTVKEITLFTMVLETPDGIFISAPHTCIWGSPLKNYTRNGKRRMELPVRIAYSDSVDIAFKVLNDIITEETLFLTDPPPQVLLQSLDDSSVKVSIRAWAGNDNYWDIYWKLTKTIKEKIEAAGLHIPFPQCDLHVSNK